MLLLRASYKIVAMDSGLKLRWAMGWRVDRFMAVAVGR